ncbi:phenoloxidase-activating factor 2 isoform X2 [Anabrus simplex]|uniref:phenoloxidase-activating factor 2 isoform X2 n=1 Tax=Anabrus simplex TaxID=316456 RepID=UPI0035A33411
MRYIHILFSLCLVLAVRCGNLGSFRECPCEQSSGCYCVQHSLCRTVATIEGSALPHARLNATSHGCSEGEVCCGNLRKKFTSRASRQPVACGVRGPVYRILRGETDTGPGEFPWMLAVMKNENSKWKFHCGASIISKNIALTAAHCVDDYEDNVGKVAIRADYWDLKDKEFEQLKVEKVVLHPEYSSDPPRNDIALIITQSNFRLGENVSPVCIPPKTFTFPPGTRCIATGWGRNTYVPNDTEDTEMKKVEVPIVSREICQRRLRRTFLGRSFRLHKSFMCAGGESQMDTCQGDGGSPLVCNYKDYYFQAGIVSWGIGCGVPRLPGVYTDVTLYRDWIKEALDLYA